MKKSYKEEILFALSKPSTVTEIKKKIPRIKSFGTLAYHLKNLQEEGKVIKKKETKKRGQPTTYSITSPELKKLLTDFTKLTELKSKYKTAYLKKVLENPCIEDKELLNKLEQEGFDPDSVGDASMDCIAERMTVFRHEITPKGQKFLEENKELVESHK